MRPSNVFIAATFLVSTGLLILFGITALSPLGGSRQEQVEADAARAEALTRPKVDFGNPGRGAEDPAVTIVEYGDHHCEPCADMERDLLRILADFPGRVRVVWKDFPNKDLHPDALAAAEGARCAGLQGAFWEFHDLLLANQGATGNENRTAMAGQLGLDLESFRACMDTASTQPAVLRDVEEALRLRIDGTPYLFIGDRRVSGAVGYDQIRTFVEAALAGAE